MKKYLSLVLAFALILTTVVLPMSASAAGTVTVEISTNADTYYPGDTLTLTVSATDAEQTKYDFVSMMVSYDKDNLTFVSEGAVVTNNATQGSVSYVGENVTVETTSTTLFTANFTVNDTLTASELTFKTADKENVQATSFAKLVNNIYEEAYDKGQVTKTARTTQRTFTVTVDPTDADAENITLVPGTLKTFNDKDSVAITVAMTEGTTNANIKAELYTVNTEESSEVKKDDFTLGTPYTLDEAGTYKIKVNSPGMAEAVYNFKYTKEDINAAIYMNVEDVANSYPKGVETDSQFTIPVVITGIGSYTVGIASFDVTYDATKLTLDTKEDLANKLTYSAGTGAGTTEAKVTVSYAANEGVDGDVVNGTQIAGLKFTANADTDPYAYGDAAITLDGGTWSPALEEVYAVDETLAASGGATSKTVVVTPATIANYATVGDFASDWTGIAYNVTVSEPANGVTVKFVEADSIVEASNYANATDLDTIDNNGTGVIVDNDTKAYTIIASVGTANPVYTVLKAAKAGATDGDVLGTYLDRTAPTFEEYSAPTSWVNTTAGSEADKSVGVTYTDSGSGSVTYAYSFTGEDDYSEYASAIEVPDGTSAKQIWVIAKDAVGNKSDAKQLDVKFDGVAPEVTATAGDITDNGKYITISASDDTSGIEKVELYKGEDDTNSVDITNELTKNDEGKIVAQNYEVKVDGTYFVKVTDGAKISTMSTPGVLIVTAKVTASPIKVAVVKNNATAEGFVPGENSNGTFNYIKIEVAEQDNCESELVLIKDNNTDSPVAQTDENSNVYEIDAANNADSDGEYVLTVKTVRGGVAADSGEATYTFSLTDTALGMKSATEDAYYNALDYAIMKAFTADVNTWSDGAAGQFKRPDAETPGQFKAGYYSADVDGDLMYTTKDTQTVLDAIRAGNFAGTYDFAIFNGLKDTSTNPF